MRVLHIGKFFPPHVGGIERYSADLCTALAARGVATAMLAHAPPGTHRTRHYRADAVDVTLAACHGQLIYAPISPSFSWLIPRLIAEFKPDILHIHTPNTSAFLALLLPSARHLPWVLQWHSDVPLDTAKPMLRAVARFYRPWENALLRRARAIVASSAQYRDSSRTLAPWLAKTEVIPLGLPEPTVSAVRGKSIQWPGPGLRLLAVGRLSYYKGFDILLRALAELAQVSLVLIGSGECEKQLKALAQRLEITDRVHFAGHTDDATLAATYANAEAFCLPSIERTEAFGMVLVEAMRAGSPTIASAIPGSGVGYLITNEVSGLLVPPADAKALAQALHRLATEPALRAKLGIAGRARWQSEFTMERCADRTLALYQSVLDPDPHRST